MKLGGRTAIHIPKISSPASNHKKTVLMVSMDKHKKGLPNSMVPKLQNLRKQVSLFRSCTLCVQGSAQRQDVARPHAVSLSLPLGVPSAREGPAPRAQVASELALSCPSPGASAPLGGADAPLCSSSRCGGANIAGALVMPNANRPREALARGCTHPLADGPAPAPLGPVGSGRPW